jgi:hypothetical protein
MKRFSILFFIAFFPVSAFSAGDALVYSMSVKKIMLKKSDGNWITISNPDVGMDVDVAAASPGAAATSLMSDTKIPPGSYVNFKIEVSKEWKISGNDSSVLMGCLGGPYYTKAGGKLEVIGKVSKASCTNLWGIDDPPFNIATFVENVETATTNIGEMGEIEVSLSLGRAGGATASGNVEISGVSDLSVPINIFESSKISMYFSFNTKNTVHCVNFGGGNHTVFFTPPGSGTEFGITVDGAKYVLNGNEMKMCFPS